MIISSSYILVDVINSRQRSSWAICPRMHQVTFLTISHSPGCEIGPQFKRSFTILILICAIYPQVDLYALEVEFFWAQKIMKQVLHVRRM